MINIIDETCDYILAWKEPSLPTTPTLEHPDSFISRLIQQRPDLNVADYARFFYKILKNNKLTT